MARFQRARQPEQKEVRRRAILKAARDLAREVGPIAVGLNELGRRSGVSKPNIYRYFESREEILFRLYLTEMTEMVEAVQARLDAARGPLDIAGVATVLSEEHLSRPLLCQLAGMVSSILEHNMSADAIASVKRDFAELLPRAGEALRSALPWLSEADAWMVIQSIELQLAGLWPVANPSRAAREVLSRPEFASMCVDASRDYPRFIEILLEGLRSKTKERTEPRAYANRDQRARSIAPGDALADQPHRRPATRSATTRTTSPARSGPAGRIGQREAATGSRRPDSSGTRPFGSPRVPLSPALK